MQDSKLKWQAYEYEYTERPRDWYWALGILALAFSITSIILGNVLFAVFILVAAFSAALHSRKPPEIFTFELNPKGIRINDKIYPYQTLRSFWIDDEIYFDQMIVRSEKKLMPHLIIPLGNMDLVSVREYMLNYLPEEEMREPFTHKLLEYFGF
jgi:hypothetical protein